MPDAATVGTDCAPPPENAGCRDAHSDLPNQPRYSQQLDVHVFFFVATPEIENARVCPARETRAGRRSSDKPRRKPDVTSHPDAERSDVFVLWLSNFLLSGPLDPARSQHGSLWVNSGTKVPGNQHVTRVR